MVKVLDRYVFSEGLRFFLLTLTTFLLLFAVIDFVSNFDLTSKVGLKGLLLYVAGRLPLYGVRVLPIATLIGTMLTLSKFSESNELTVARALGISTYRFSAPLLVLAALASLLSVGIQDRLVPEGLRKATEVALKAHKEAKGPERLPGVWFKDKKGDF